MKHVNHHEILEGNIRQGLWHLALPLMFLNLINSLYNIVDTFWIGKMGELQIGAITLIGPIMGCGSAFITGLSAAGISLISMYIGAKKYEEANQAATHLFFVSLALGALMGMICLVFAHPILNWLETPMEIYQDAYAYLIGISFDFVFLFLINIFQTIRQSDGDSKTAVKFNALAAIFNTILDPIFIFTFHLGTFGAALATVLSKVLVMPFVLYILIQDQDHIHLQFSTSFNFNLVKKILKVGLPASFASFLTSFGFVLMNKSIVGYGPIAISAYGLGNKITDLYYIPVNAFGGALAPFIGQNLGANNQERARACYKEAMILTGITSLVVMVIGFFITKYMVYLFVQDASLQLMDLTLEYCYYVIITIFFMGWFQNLHGVFSGAADTNIVLILSTIRLWGLRIPMIYFFQKWTQFGPTGIWLAMVLSNFITCVLGQIHYNKHQWESHLKVN